MAAMSPPFRAPHMTGLYQKVIKAQYDPLPPSFSKDLSMMIRQLIQVQPISRPTCEKILSSPALMRNLTDTIRDKLDFDDEEEISPNKRRLLNTIKVPKDLSLMSDRLPKPQYHINSER
jgi:NIMA (never in mitosis gene a)-related kinase